MAERKGFKAVDSRGLGAMTTDNRTNEPTPEQIVSEALGTYGLIGRARDLAARNAVEQLRTHGLLPKGAPTEDDREALIDVVKRNRSVVKRMSDGYPSVVFVTDETIADAILAAGFSRAAVPDAANRELTEAIRLTVEYVGNDMLPAIEGWDWYDALVKYAPEVAQAFVDKPIHFPKSAERDAALAVLERVRAIAERHGMKPWTEEIFAALDGAPEPETPELFPGTNAALDRLTVRKAAPAEAFCIEHGNFHAVELGDPTCEFEDGFGEPVDGEKP